VKNDQLWVTPVIFKKLPKENKPPKNSSNLVTLYAMTVCSCDLLGRVARFFSNQKLEIGKIF
jgi:hypothetical protein